MKEKNKKQNFWLLKTEPTSYNIDGLKHDKKTAWTGIRNFQVRNMLRDQFGKGDMCLIYHSSCEQIGVVGVAEVASSGYPDPTQFDPKDHHFDPKSVKKQAKTADKSKPDPNLWYCVDVKFVKKFKKTLTLSEIKLDPKLSGMLVTIPGSRLSIQPVSQKHFEYILKQNK